MVNKTLTVPLAVPPSNIWEGNDGPWSTFSIHVGTPAQAARVLVSTTVGETWTISANETQGGCLPGDPSNCAQLRGGLVNVNDSTTWQDQGIYALGDEVNLPDYTTGYDNGDYGFDSLGIGKPGSGGVTLDNQVVAVLATKDFYLGNLGVTSRPTNFTQLNDPHPSFLSSLKAQGHVPSLTFGYSAGNQYRLQKVPGSLTLGGYDQSKFTPNGISFQFAPDISRDLVVGLQSITFSDNQNTNKPLLSDGILAFVDATIPHIWLPQDACTSFEKAFNLQYNSTVDRYLVNDTLHDQLRQQNASVSFILGTDISGGASLTITLPYAAFDLEVDPPIVNTTSKYFPLRRADNETQYTLGRTFLQESYLIVDYERSNFSISQSLFEANDPQQLVAISPAGNSTTAVQDTASSSLSLGAIIGIVIGAVALLIIAGVASFFIKRRRKRRKEAQEAELKKATEPVDPMEAKAEMPDNSKTPLGGLYSPGKQADFTDPKSTNEMEGTEGEYFNHAKLHAEMEGSKGGAEMEGAKGFQGPPGLHEMQAAHLAPPVEMWAGSHGLQELPSPIPSDSGRPSPASRIPSSSSAGRPSPASAGGKRRSGRLSRRRNGGARSPFAGGESSGVSSPTEQHKSGRDSEQETRRAGGFPTSSSSSSTPMVRQEGPDKPARGGERARRGDELTRRMESGAKSQGSSPVSLASPISADSEQDRTRGWPNRGADHWNSRFGSRPREQVASQGPSISSPSSDRSRDRRLPPTPMELRSSEEHSRRGLMGPSRLDSWTSRVSSGGRSGEASHPSSRGGGSENMPGGYF